jgi:hypothetical protein
MKKTSFLRRTVSRVKILIHIKNMLHGVTTTTLKSMKKTLDTLTLILKVLVKYGINLR